MPSADLSDDIYVGYTPGYYGTVVSDVSKGGIANISDSIYAGKDGNVYKYDKGDGWQQVRGEGKFNRAIDLGGEHGQ